MAWAAMAIGCTENELTTENSKNELRVTATLPATRVALTAGDNVTHAVWEKNDLIGLFCDQETPDMDGENRVVSYKVANIHENSADFAPYSTPLSCEEGETVYAFYSSYEYVAGTCKMRCYTDDSQPALYAKGEVTDNELNLNFNHALAYIKLSLDKEIIEDDGYPCLQQITLQSEKGNHFGSFTFDPKSGEIEIDNAYSTQTAQTSEAVNLNEQSWESPYIPVIPGQEGEISIYASMRQADGTYQKRTFLTARKTPAGGFKAGCIYTLSPASEDFELRIVLSQKEVTVSDKGATIEVNLQANTDFSIDMPAADWIHPIDTRAMNGYTRRFQVDENTSTDARSAVIVFGRKALGVEGVEDYVVEEQLTIVQKGMYNAVTQEVSAAGSLASLMEDKECDRITSLTLTGELNGDDILFIRGMQNLLELDLSGCKIISGGECYYNTYRTSEHVLGNYMFAHLKLKSIALPTDIVQINANAFCYTPIESIVIPEGVESIGYECFRYCQALNKITLPKSLRSIAAAAFAECYELRHLYISSIEDWCKIAFARDDSNPFTSTGDYSGGIHEGNLYVNGELATEITIPSSIQKINDYAFRRFDCLTSVTLPDGLTQIGAWAFALCPNLQQCNIPQSVSYIGEDAFCNTALRTVTLPEGMRVVNTGLFSGCTELTSVTLASTIHTIGADAFFGCKKLAGIALPDAVTIIGDHAFYGCTQLASLNNSRQLITIGKGAFEGCESLTAIELPETLSSIGYDAFYECSSLATVKIADLEQWCYVNIGSGFNHVVGSPFLYAKEVYFNGKPTTDIIIPEFVNRVDRYIFYGYNSLKSITLHKGISEVGTEALGNCRNLLSVTCLAETPPVFDYINGLDEQCTLYVPQGTSAAYKSKWGEVFSHIEELP